MQSGFKNVAIRQVAAHSHLVQMLCDFGNITQETAERVASYYLKHKLAKLDAVMGTASVKHGMFLDADVIANAVEITK